MRCVGRPDADELAVALAMPSDPFYSSTFVGMGAWVEHLSAPRDDMISTLVQEALQIPQVSWELCAGH